MSEYNISPKTARRNLSFVEDDFNAQLLGCALKGLDAHEGSTTPTENFLMGTLISYSLGKLTPDAVERRLNEFRLDLQTLYEEQREDAEEQREEVMWSECVGV